jgi:hypothetical protein
MDQEDPVVAHADMSFPSTHRLDPAPPTSLVDRLGADWESRSEKRSSEVLVMIDSIQDGWVGSSASSAFAISDAVPERRAAGWILGWRWPEWADRLFLAGSGASTLMRAVFDR